MLISVLWMVCFAIASIAHRCSMAASPPRWQPIQRSVVVRSIRANKFRRGCCHSRVATHFGAATNVEIRNGWEPDPSRESPHRKYPVESSIGMPFRTPPYGYGIQNSQTTCTAQGHAQGSSGPVLTWRWRTPGNHQETDGLGQVPEAAEPSSGTSVELSIHTPHSL